MQLIRPHCSDNAAGMTMVAMFACGCLVLMLFGCCCRRRLLDSRYPTRWCLHKLHQTHISHTFVISPGDAAYLMRTNFEWACVRICDVGRVACGYCVNAYICMSPFAVMRIIYVRLPSRRRVLFWMRRKRGAKGGCAYQPPANAFSSNKHTPFAWWMECGIVGCVVVIVVVVVDDVDVAVCGLQMVTLRGAQYVYWWWSVRNAGCIPATADTPTATHLNRGMLIFELNYLCSDGRARNFANWHDSEEFLGKLSSLYVFRMIINIL